MISDRFKNHPLKNELLTRYKDGDTASALASWLQLEMLEFTDVGKNTLAEALRTFFNATFNFEQKMWIQNNRSEISKTTAKNRHDLNLVEEYEKLFALQMGRVELEHKKERSIGHALSSGSNELELARRILNDMARTKMDLGVERKVASQSQLDITTGGNPIAPSIDDPAIKKKLGLVLNKMSLMSSANTIPDINHKKDEDVVDAEVVMVTNDKSNKTE